MRRPLPAFAPALALTATLAACSSPQGGFPSLAITPAERAYWQAKPATPEPVASETPIPLDATLIQRLAVLTANAQAAHQQFLSRKDRADQLTSAAQGRAMGSEQWSVAQVALAVLESARNSTSLQLTDIDAMLLAARMASVNAPSPDLAPVQAAHDQVNALLDEESATVNAFTARLSS